ncbi:MAG: hypothetical protein KDD94_01140, partial [Calditrichaeota bacterium]|nr:hypothetical protein [Calditrichota bacterium]
HLFDIEPVTFSRDMNLRGFYLIGEESAVEIEILDKEKNVVRTIRKAKESAGYHEFSWDGQPDNPEDRFERVKRGQYFVRLTVDGDEIERELQFK